MAPEYFPRLDFFRRLLAGDSRVDPNHPYAKQSYMNRSRLRTPDGSQWITVPVVGRQRGVPVSEVVIDNSVPWRGKHLRAFQYNYRSTPYFEAYEDRLSEFFERDWKTLGPLVVASIELTQDFLGHRSSVTGRRSAVSDHPTPETGYRTSDLAPRTSDLAPRTSDPEPRTSDLEPRTSDLAPRTSDPQYVQNFPGFVPDLSALDAFFNLGPSAIDLISEETEG